MKKARKEAILGGFPRFFVRARDGNRTRDLLLGKET